MGAASLALITSPLFHILQSQRLGWRPQHKHSQRLHKHRQKGFLPPAPTFSTTQISCRHFLGTHSMLLGCVCACSAT